jgi:hypothetical protein
VSTSKEKNKAISFSKDKKNADKNIEEKQHRILF